MTADEIRDENGDGLNADEAMFYMLREIAAQLAELNQKLDAIAETYVLSGGKR